MRHEVRDHRRPAPLLALVDVGEMNLDDRRLEQLERVPDRVAVVRPRGRVDDDAVRPVERFMDPVDVLALVVRLFALRTRADIARPLVDARLELSERQPPYTSGSRRPRTFRLTPFRTRMRMRRP